MIIMNDSSPQNSWLTGKIVEVILEQEQDWLSKQSHHNGFLHEAEEAEENVFFLFFVLLCSLLTAHILQIHTTQHMDNEEIRY